MTQTTALARRPRTIRYMEATFTHEDDFDANLGGELITIDGVDIPVIDPNDVGMSDASAFKDVDDDWDGLDFEDLEGNDLYDDFDNSAVLFDPCGLDGLD